LEEEEGKGEGKNHGGERGEKKRAEKLPRIRIPCSGVDLIVGEGKKKEPYQKNEGRGKSAQPRFSVSIDALEDHICVSRRKKKEKKPSPQRREGREIGLPGCARGSSGWRSRRCQVTGEEKKREKYPQEKKKEKRGMGKASTNRSTAAITRVR